MTAQTILKQALKLPRRSRIRIAEQLFESTLDDNVLKAGAKIAEERRRAFERGEIGAKPLAEVIKRLRKRQQGPKA